MTVWINISLSNNWLYVINNKLSANLFFKPLIRGHMNVFSSNEPAWPQIPSLLNKESAGKCLQNIVSSLASPVTHQKVVLVACVLFSLVSVAEAKSCEDCYKSFGSCNDVINNFIGLALLGPAHFLIERSCGDQLKNCLQYC